MKAVFSTRNAERALVVVLIWFGAAPALIPLVDAAREAHAGLQVLAWSGALFPLPFMPLLLALPREAGR